VTISVLAAGDMFFQAVEGAGAAGITPEQVRPVDRAALPVPVLYRDREGAAGILEQGDGGKQEEGDADPRRVGGGQSQGAEPGKGPQDPLDVTAGAADPEVEGARGPRKPVDREG
jgi:hypothetical protein